MTAGGCNCSAATYRVTGPLRPFIDCRCLQCRKTSGFHVAATSDPAKRAFCSTCGSNLFWDGAGCTSVDLRRQT